MSNLSISLLSSRVLIDKGSTLNVCLVMTLSQIGVDDLVWSNGMMVRAFDVTKISTCGEIILKVLIRPCKLEVSFVVVDISKIFKFTPWQTMDTFCRGHFVQLTPKGQVYIKN